MSNPAAMKALSKIVERARRSQRLTAYQVGQTLGLPTSFVSTVESGEFDPFHPDLERLLDLFGIPLKILDACKAPPRESTQEARNGDAVTPPNVIDFATRRAKKWQQTSTSETD